MVVVGLGLGWLVGVWDWKRKSPACCRAFWWLGGSGSGRYSGGIGIAVWDRRGFLLMETWDGTVVAKPADRLPKQFVSQSGHGNPTALSLAVKGADHIVGQLWGIQGSGHGWGGLRLVGEHENAPNSQGDTGHERWSRRKAGRRTASVVH